MARLVEGTPGGARALGDALLQIAPQLFQIIGVVFDRGACQRLDDIARLHAVDPAHLPRAVTASARQTLAGERGVGPLPFTGDFAAEP